MGIPFLLETEYIFNLWLDEVPQYAVIFTQLSIVAILISKYTTQIGHAIYAVGKIRLYQVLEATLSFISLGIIYLFYRLGFEPVTAYWIGIAFGFLFAVERYILGKKIVGLDLWDYTKETVFKTLWPIFISVALAILILLCLEPGFLRLFFVFFVFCLSYTLIFFAFGVNKEEKQIWYGLLKGVTSKIKKSI